MASSPYHEPCSRLNLTCNIYSGVNALITNRLGNTMSYGVAKFVHYTFPRNSVIDIDEMLNSFKKLPGEYTWSTKAGFDGNYYNCPRILTYFLHYGGCVFTFQSRNSECYGVSKHQRLDSLLSCFFQAQIKHQSSASQVFVRANIYHQWIPSTKGQ